MMKISVVIPCHNAEPYVAQTIGSLLEQTRPPDEIIVVDDRSTDGSREVVRRFGGRVRVLAVDFGVAGKTRNAGAAVSTGDAIMFLDADDVLAPETLAALEQTLQEAPHGIAACPWFRLEQHDGQWVQRYPSIPNRRWPRDLLVGWLTGYYYPPCSVLWSRTAFQRIGGWQDDYNPNDDGDLMMRALIDGIPLRRSKHGAALYRRIPGNASLSGQRLSDRGLRAWLRGLDKVQAWLEERQRFDEYRLPFAAALSALERDARQGGHDDVRRLIHHRRRACLAVAWGDGARLQTWHWARQGEFALRQWRKKVRAQRRGPATPELPVEYGLRAAAEASRQPESEASVLEVMPARPAVSVIIPTYNRAGLVCRAIRSVLAQTYSDLEVLVVDDASTDGTAEAVATLQDHRVRYCRQPKNLDVSAARNRGLREARGDFIAFLDSDDEWYPRKLEKQMALFQQLPEKVGLVYCGSELVLPDGQTVVSEPMDRGEVLGQLLLKNITCSGSASAVIRREVVRTVGFFDEEIAAMEDYDYWIRTAKFYDFDYVPEPLVRYYDVELPDRRSLVREDDIRARERLWRKFRPELKRRRLLHAYLLVSANRRLYRIQPIDRRGAFWLALRALLIKPTHGAPYRALARTLLPPRVGQWVHPAYAQKAAPSGIRAGT